MKFEVYKIKNSETGLYSRGGVDPRWGVKGKAWSGKGPLKSHLRQFCTDYMYLQSDGSLTGSGFYSSTKTIKGWWNEIPETWIVEHYTPDGMTQYPAKGLYPETSYELN